jgi:hypothetical protein
MSRGRPLAFQQIHLVIAIQMILVAPVSELHALQQLVDDVRIPGCGAQSREPI